MTQANLAPADPRGVVLGQLWRRARRTWLPRVALGSLLLIVVVALWAAFYDHTDFLPAPIATWNTAIELLQEPATYDNLLATARRLAVGLAIGYVGAVMTALLMRQSAWWKRMLSVYVLLAISIPGLAMSLISLMVFGLSEVGVYIAVAAVVFPFAVVNLSEGFDDLDATLADMARTYRFSTWQRIRHVTIPEMAPYLFSAFRNVHALAWKLVVIAELFSQSEGVGYQYQIAYRFAELERLIVWAGFFIAMVVIVEYGLLRPFESAVFRWRNS